MNIKNSKKSMILYYIVIPGFLLGLVMFYISSLQAAEQEIRYVDFIGEKQLETIRASADAEKYLLFIDKAAKLSFQDSINKVASNGGFAIASGCGQFKGYQLWNTEEKQCYPVEYKNDIQAMFFSSFYDHLNSLPVQQEDVFTYDLPSLEYDLYLGDSAFIGTSQEDISVDIFLSENKLAEYSINPSFNINLDYNLSEFRDIMDRAAFLVERCKDSSEEWLGSCIKDNLPDSWNIGPCESVPAPEQRTYRFCTSSSTKIFTYEQQDTASYKNITYRFALYFPEP